jgi:hypothetical protein
VIDDRNYQGVDAEAIREIIRSILQELQSPAPPATSQGILLLLAEKDQLSVDELVQQVREAKLSAGIASHFARSSNCIPEKCSISKRWMKI